MFCLAFWLFDHLFLFHVFSPAMTFADPHTSISSTRIGSSLFTLAAGSYIPITEETEEITGQAQVFSLFCPDRPI